MLILKICDLWWENIWESSFTTNRICRQLMFRIYSIFKDISNIDSSLIQHKDLFLKSVTCKKLVVCFDCGEDSSKELVHNVKNWYSSFPTCSFFRSLIKDRDLGNTEVVFSCDRKHEETCSRDIFMTLPKMEKFTLSKGRIDDDSLLHIVSRTHHSELLEYGIFSTNGILKAFEASKLHQFEWIL